MALLIGPGGLHEDNCGTWDYTPNVDLQEPAYRAQWFAQQVDRLLVLLGDFAEVDFVEVHAADSEVEWEWKPSETLDGLLSEIRSKDQVLSVVVWLSLSLTTGEAEHLLSAGVVRFVVYEDPFGHEVSVRLDTHAYAGRPGLPAKAVQVNHARLAAFLRRIESGLDVRFNYCESQAFPDRIHRLGYHPAHPLAAS